MTFSRTPSRAIAAVALLLLSEGGGHAAPVGCVSHTLPNSPSANNGGTYYLCAIDTKVHPDALCNDGSTPVFQLQPAPRSSRWVIWLAGGHECVDATSCLDRATNPLTHHFVTSVGTRPRAGQGVLSHDPAVDPALADANTVLVNYCSSDAWSGGYRAPNGRGGFVASDPATWNFEGRAIVEGAVGTLAALGVGFPGATEVVLGGSSAGGVGITVTARDLLPLLPGGARVLLANDAGFTLNLGRYDTSSPKPYVFPGFNTPLDRLLGQGIALWHGRGDAGCDARAKSGDAHVDCYNTATLLQDGSIGLPAFVAVSQLDTPEVLFQICPTKDGKCAIPHDPSSPTGIYAAFYARQMARLISEGGAASLPYVAFSPDSYVHTMLDQDASFLTPFRFSSGSLTARDSFNRWYAHPGARGLAFLGTGPGVQ